MNILIPTDFSESSLQSYAFAIQIADRIDCHLNVVHFFKQPLLPETTFGIQPPPGNPSLVKELSERAERLWIETRHQFPTRHPVEFFAICDDVVRGIVNFVQSRNIELVVMSHRQDKSEFFIGSVVHDVLKKTAVPVLNLSSPVSFADIKTILLPHDLETGQTRFMELVKNLQQLFNARLDVLFVNTPEHFHTDDEIRSKLDAFAREHNLQNYGLHYRSHRSEYGGIASYLKEADVSMIAMGTHGRKGLAHFLKGSVAESVMERSTKPLWVVNVAR